MALALRSGLALVHSSCSYLGSADRDDRHIDTAPPAQVPVLANVPDFSRALGGGADYAARGPRVRASVGGSLRMLPASKQCTRAPTRADLGCSHGCWSSAAIMSS